MAKSNVTDAATSKPKPARRSTKKAEKPKVQEAGSNNTVVETKPVPVVIAPVSPVAVVEVRQQGVKAPNIIVPTAPPPVLTEDARLWFFSKNSLVTGFAPCTYLKHEIVRDIARGIGRPLELDEVKLFVVEDGRKETCYISKVEFQPIRWWLYTDEEAKAILGGKSFKDVVPTAKDWGGSFYPVPIDDEGHPMALAGSPYWFIKESGYSKNNSNSELGTAIEYKKAELKKMNPNQRRAAVVYPVSRDIAIAAIDKQRGRASRFDIVAEAMRQANEMSRKAKRRY